jgi:MscS family membrane protein
MEVVMRLESLLCGIVMLSLAGVGGGRAAEAEPKFLEDKTEPDLDEGLGPPLADLDRSTPRRTARAIAEACRLGATGRGMRLLNLLQIPADERGAMGQVLFRQLCEILPRGRATPEGALSDADIGPIHDTRPLNHETLAEFDTPDGKKSLWLRRYGSQKTGERAWLLTRQSVSMLPVLHRALSSPATAVHEPSVPLNPGLGPAPSDLAAANPSQAVGSFLAAWRKGDMERAAHLLDLAPLPEERQARSGARLARRLGLLIQRLAPAGFPALSNDEDGTPEMGVPVDEERLLQRTLDDSAVELRLLRRRLPDGASRWTFAPSVTAAINGLYARYGYGWFGDNLPVSLFRSSLLGLQIWQWAGLLGFLALAALLSLLLGRALGWLLGRMARLSHWAWDDRMAGRLRGPLGLLAFSLLLALAGPGLYLAEDAREGLGRGRSFLLLVAVGWMVLRAIDAGAEELQARFAARGDGVGKSMVPIGRRILKPVVGVIVLIVALQNAGLNVSGLLAGLGIGGLALALAGKTTLENLFGSITIAFDRPFKVGDWIQVGEHAGTVEDVGLRSTRIRTIERTLVTIPNGQLADARVQNFTARDRMRLAATFTLRYETTLEQLRYLVDAFKRYLIAHPRVWPEFHRVRFVGYNSSSVDIEVFVYLTTTDFHEFTGLREEILLELGRRVQQAGVQFAFGSQTLYLGQDRPPDPARAEEIGASVRQRVERGDLWMPEPPPPVPARGTKSSGGRP